MERSARGGQRGKRLGQLIVFIVVCRRVDRVVVVVIDAPLVVTEQKLGLRPVHRRHSLHRPHVFLFHSWHSKSRRRCRLCCGSLRSECPIDSINAVAEIDIAVVLVATETMHLPRLSLDHSTAVFLIRIHEHTTEGGSRVDLDKTANGLLLPRVVQSTPSIIAFSRARVSSTLTTNFMTREMSSLKRRKWRD